MNKYIPVIGLEIHVELKTKSKMFCQCAADYFGKKPNTHTCPVCLGLPGALPVPNQQAVDWTILVGKALNCAINKQSKFDRKHYFYPDLPKGYQISQYDEPIAIKGQIVIASPDGFTSGRGNLVNHVDEIASSPAKLSPRNDMIIRIRRVHLEEDTGKLIHKEDKTLIDFNRSGVPLVEIVTEPDFDSADDVKRFLEELQVIIRYLGVSDADMEKGTMRLEPNISLSVRRSTLNVKRNKDKLPNYKVEVKNINSFRFVKQAIEYEIERQTAILEKGETPKQETRGFSESKQATYLQRSKEQAHDYRYFPEPDIPTMSFSDEYLQRIYKQLPELPQEKIERYQKELSLGYQEAFIITRNLSQSNYYESVISKIKNQKSLLRASFAGAATKAEQGFGGQAKSHIKNKKYEQAIANFIVNKKISIDQSVDEFIKRAVQLLSPIETDVHFLDTVITKVIKENNKVVSDYKRGKINALMFLVGQVMREMKGKADPKTVIEKLKQQLV